MFRIVCRDNCYGSNAKFKCKTIVSFFYDCIQRSLFQLKATLFLSILLDDKLLLVLTFWLLSFIDWLRGLFCNAECSIVNINKFVVVFLQIYQCFDFEKQCTFKQITPINRERNIQLRVKNALYLKTE